MIGYQKIAIFFLSLFFLFSATLVKAEFYNCGCMSGSNCTPFTVEGFGTEGQNNCRSFCANSGYETNLYADAGTVCGIEAETSTSAAPSTTAVEDTSSSGGSFELIAGNSSTTYQKPFLSVGFPNFSFSDVINDNGYLEINWLGEYINGLYKFLLSIGGIFAVLMVMIGGIQYVISRGGGEATEAKKRIGNAITGLVLLFCVFIILYTVNPGMISFDALRIQNILPIELSFYKENFASCPDVANTVKACSVQTFTNPGSWSTELVALINEFGASKSIDPILLATHLQKETGGSATYGRGRGPCGEIGPAQFMPTTFEVIVGLDCCTDISRKRGLTSGDASACTSTTSAWPPSFSFSCRSDICSNCQEAATSCIDYFDTSVTGGLRHVVDAQAKFVKNTLLRVKGDLALEMCAYNGSGKAAAEYAKSAAQIYSSLCQSSGGTQ